MGYDVAKK